MGIGELYIIVCLNTYNFDEMKNIKLFEGVYEFSPRDSLQLMIRDSLLVLYSSVLYKSIDSISANDDFPLYRGSMTEFDNSPRKKEASSFLKVILQNNFIW